MSELLRLAGIMSLVLLAFSVTYLLVTQAKL
jgi:hypothetical protein